MFRLLICCLVLVAAGCTAGRAGTATVSLSALDAASCCNVQECCTIDCDDCDDCDEACTGKHCCMIVTGEDGEPCCCVACCILEDGTCVPCCVIECDTDECRS